jgi:hypothetical protein
MALRKPNAPCRVCGIRPRTEAETDGMGRVVYVLTPCWHEVRLAAGKCLDCDAPRVGARLRCEKHRIAKKKRDRAAASSRYDKSPAGRARKNAFQSTPEYREKAAAAKRERWKAMPPEQKAAELEKIRNRYQLFSGPGYWKRKQWERTTRERQKAKRAERLQQKEAA